MIDWKKLGNNWFVLIVGGMLFTALAIAVWTINGDWP